MIRRLGLCLLLLIFSAEARSDRALPFFTARDLSPYWENEGGGSPAALDALTVVDQEGAAVSEKDLSGRLSVVNFFFGHCPDICPRMMEALRRLEKKIPPGSPELHLYSLSVTPARDSPAALRSFAQKHGLNLARWSLLTGKEDEIFRAGREIFNADRKAGRRPGDGENSFLHSTHVYLLDPRRRIRGVYDSAQDSQMALLEKDIVRLRRDKRSPAAP